MVFNKTAALYHFNLANPNTLTLFTVNSVRKAYSTATENICLQVWRSIYCRNPRSKLNFVLTLKRCKSSGRVQDGETLSHLGL